MWLATCRFFHLLLLTDPRSAPLCPALLAASRVRIDRKVVFLVPSLLFFLCEDELGAALGTNLRLVLVPENWAVRIVGLMLRPVRSDGVCRLTRHHPRVVRVRRETRPVTRQRIHNGRCFGLRLLYPSRRRQFRHAKPNLAMICCASKTNTACRPEGDAAISGTPA
jgi:hypothetical protein